MTDIDPIELQGRWKNLAESISMENIFGTPTEFTEEEFAHVRAALRVNGASMTDDELGETVDDLSDVWLRAESARHPNAHAFRVAWETYWELHHLLTVAHPAEIEDLLA